MHDFHDLANRQRAYFQTGETKEFSFRQNALRRLRQAIATHEQELLDALYADLNKSAFDAYATEVGIVLEELRFTLKHLAGWMKPRKVKTPITHLGSNSYIYPEPYGSVLIISPWNYPFQLAISPLIGAIAAGNCAVLKPSELTPRTSAVLAKLVESLFSPEFVAVVPGGIETSTALLAQKFDYIFFTGSVPVGKIVMQAAAQHLTPVTLELGGKSPCLVHADANLKLAAKRIVWGKFLNAGQTCVAPDYLLVHHEVKEELLAQMQSCIKQFYGEAPLANPNYTKIVSERHFARLQAFLQQGKIRVGGGADRDSLKIEPTLLDEVEWEDPIMQEEIFGPILPVLAYQDISDALEQIKARPKPLALYLFTQSEQIQTQVIQQVSFGGGCMNDTVFHVASPYLPFGGVGESGMGAYHGKGSFDTFSHQKSVLKQTTLFDLPFRYPDVKNGLRKLKFFLK